MSNRFLEGFFIGGALGFIFGILSAPKSGEEFRRDLADGSEDLYNRASTSVGTIKEATNQAFTGIQQKSEGVIKMAQESVNTAKENISSKIHQMAGQSTGILSDEN